MAYARSWCIKELETGLYITQWFIIAAVAAFDGTVWLPYDYAAISAIALPTFEVIEIECICCGGYDTSHSLVGVYDTFDEAHQLQKSLSEYRAKQGLVFPHTQVILVEIPEINGLVQNIVYESMVHVMNKESKKRERKQRKNKTESEHVNGQ